MRNSGLFVLDSFPKWPQQTVSTLEMWFARGDLHYRNHGCFCSNKPFKQSHILLLENALIRKNCTWSTPVYKVSKLSSSHDFRFSGAGERKACRRCLDLMTTLVDAVLPTSWHITEWVKTPIWRKQKKPSVFQGNYYEIQFRFPYISLPISKSQMWNSCCGVLRGKANIAH